MNKAERMKKRRKEVIKNLKRLTKHKGKKNKKKNNPVCGQQREGDSKADMLCLLFMSLWGSRASVEGRR